MRKGEGNRSCYINNKLKSENLNDKKKKKKKEKTKCLSAINKNLNWLLLNYRMGLKIKNVNIMGVHQFLGEECHKKQLYTGNCLKRGDWKICRGLGKK